jgi:hypothetical protein
MNKEPSNLVLVWTTADREVAMNMILMYGRNARRFGWWDQVNLLIWGPSDNVLLADEALKTEIKAMIDEGVEVIACKACADRYGISDALSELGVKVFYTGEALTNAVKSPDWAVLTF